MPKEAKRKNKMIAPQEEIDELAKRLIECRAKIAKSKKRQAKLQAYQNECVEKLKFLVTNRARRYRQFSNHPDLEQDGFEALLLALKTYDSSKGSFSWWCDKYVNTRIYRAANAHSTIRVPIKKARELKPYKITNMPVIIDSMDIVDEAQRLETQHLIQKALAQLTPAEQQVITLMYGFQGAREQTLEQISQTLQIPRSQSIKLLEEAKNKLKEILGTQDLGL